jgi:hypothetical protein
MARTMCPISSRSLSHLHAVPTLSDPSPLQLLHLYLVLWQLLIYMHCQQCNVLHWTEILNSCIWWTKHVQNEHATYISKALHLVSIIQYFSPSHMEYFTHSFITQNHYEFYRLPTPNTQTKQTNKKIDLRSGGTQFKSQLCFMVFTCLVNPFM